MSAKWISPLLMEGTAAAATTLHITHSELPSKTLSPLNIYSELKNDIEKNKDAGTGLPYYINDVGLYIFTGNAGDVDNIYKSYNIDGKLPAGKLTKVNGNYGIQEGIRFVPDKLAFNGKMAYTTENLDKLTKSGLFGAIRNGAEGLMNISNIMGSIGSIFDKKDDSESNSPSASESYNAGLEQAKTAGKAGPSEFPLYINRYKNVPYYTDYNMESLTSICFKFNFGQSRLFSALEEVVKPIVGLVNIFNIKPENSTGFFSAKDIMPNKTEALTKMYSSLFGGKDGSDPTSGWGVTASDKKKYKTVWIVDGAKNNDNTPMNFNSKEEAGQWIETHLTSGKEKNSAWNSIESKKIESEGGTTIASASDVQGIFNNLAVGFANAITEAAKGNTVTGIFLNIGRNIMGPFVPTSIEWNFDFSKVDEYGYPCFGDITFNGLKMIDMNPAFITEAWGLGDDRT